MPTPVYDAVAFPAAFAEWSRLVKSGETAIDQHASDAAEQFKAVLDRLNGVVAPVIAEADALAEPAPETAPEDEPAPEAPAA